MELKKINKTAVIVAVVLTVTLIVSIIVSVVNAGKDKNTENSSQVTEDIIVPDETMNQRYIFTNDIAGITDFSALLKTEAAVNAKLIRFEKKDVLGKMDERALKNLTKGADTLSEETVLQIGSKEIPTQPGIYRSVLEIKDVTGNVAYEEVFIILDKTSALINDAEDVVVRVPKEKLSEKPEIDTTIYKGYDEVDGILTYKQLNFDLTLMDEAKHEWKLTISYTDRAGNYSEALYRVTVVEETEQFTENNAENNSTEPGNTNTGDGNVSDIAPDINKYDPMDANKDGSVSVEEEMMYITPAKQKCIDAGYGVVVEQDGGTWYAVLMSSNEHTINGKRGGEIIEAYLKERGLHAERIGGCWINLDNGWYWYTAEQIEEIPESTDGTGTVDWDDVDWEFND